MYGMLLESVQHFVQTDYGMEMWQRVCEIIDCRHNTFKTHQIYPDKLMPDIAAALAACTGESFDFFMNYFGCCFVRFFSNFGYERIIRSTGRYFCDFLQSIDDIHLQMRFTFPKMKSPSMQLAQCDENGAVVVYRSKRTGISKYLIGQMTEIAKSFYDLDIKVFIIESQNDISGGTTGPIQLSHEPLTVIVKYRIDFDNRDYMAQRVNIVPHPTHSRLPKVELSILLELFPFALVLNHDMIITNAGEKIVETWIVHNPSKTPKSFIGAPMSNFFRICRPKDTPFEWDVVVKMRTVLFEFELVRTGRDRRAYERALAVDIDDPDLLGITDLLVEAHMSCNSPNEHEHNTVPIQSFASFESNATSVRSNNSDELRKSNNYNKPIIVKGQMFHMNDIDSIIYLCTPLIENIDELHGIGLYLNDLNPHGLSRELVMAGWQHCSKLQILFEKEEQHADELENSLQLADKWKRQGDELLYSMIPRPIAERMRNGEEAMCQSFDAVTVIFVEVMNVYDDIGATNPTQIAMMAVNTLNTVFSAFDEEIISPLVYKVETVGMIYMAVSGAPDVNPLHAQHSCDFALRIVRKIKSLQLPNVAIRVGMHSGPVVAGVVGMRVPRYCLFGDTVNTASRMESSSEPFKIQLTKTIALKVSAVGYKVEPRGYVLVKGKGEMETFWLLDDPKQEALI